MCRHCWPAWLLAVAGSFGVLELRAFRRNCHPTLSRELQRWTAARRCRWSPLLFAAAGAVLAWHIHTLTDPPADDRLA